MNEEFAKVSDAGLQELSIVESEQNNSQVETPAAHFKKNSFGKDFRHYVAKADKQRASQESKSSTNLKPKDTQDGPSEQERRQRDLKKQDTAKSSKQKQDVIRQWPIHQSHLQQQNSEDCRPVRRNEAGATGLLGTRQSKGPKK